jgi:trk system potassium uptake protein TrkA
MRVAIAGAGNVGQFIANDLAGAGHEVLLIEQEPAVVTRGSSELSGPWPDGGRIEWRTADACEVTSLREAGLDQMDVVVAATGDDEDNLVVSLLAKQEFAVPRVVARVNHPKNEWLFNETWGVDVAVSTPHLILALTEEALSVGSLVHLLQLERGRARLVEVTLAPDSPVIGKVIRELSLPRDATFVAIVREEHVVVPRGDTDFQDGDEVLALVTPDSEDEIRQLLTGKSAAPVPGPKGSPDRPSTG